MTQPEITEVRKGKEDDAPSRPFLPYKAMCTFFPRLYPGLNNIQVASHRFEYQSIIKVRASQHSVRVSTNHFGIHKVWNLEIHGLHWSSLSNTTVLYTTSTSISWGADKAHDAIISSSKSRIGA